MTKTKYLSFSGSKEVVSIGAAVAAAVSVHLVVDPHLPVSVLETGGNGVLVRCVRCVRVTSIGCVVSAAIDLILRAREELSRLSRYHRLQHNVRNYTISHTRPMSNTTHYHTQHNIRHNAIPHITQRNITQRNIRHNATQYQINTKSDTKIKHYATKDTMLK